MTLYLYLVSSKTPHHASSQNFYLQSKVNVTFLALCQVVKNMFPHCNDDDSSIFKGQIMAVFIALEIYFFDVIMKAKNTTFIIWNDFYSTGMEF